MDFGKIISKSFQNIKHYRYLWGLGVLASLAGGSSSMPNSMSSGYNMNESDQVGPIADNISNWVSTHESAIIIATLIMFVLAIVFIYLSLRAEAGLINSVDKIENKTHFKNFSQAWASSKGYAGKLFLLGLLVCALVMGWMLVFMAMPILLMVFVQALPIYILGGILVFVGILGMILICFGLVPTVEYAKREIVLEKAGTYEAFVRSLRKIKANLGNSILAMLLQMVLNMGAGLGILIVIGVIGLILSLIGFGVYTTLGLISTVVYSIILGIPFLAVMFFLAGIVQAYFSSYWTLVYLELKK